MRPAIPRSFLPQAALILLPVVIMTVIGFVALVRDRAAVENEARQRAEELIQQFQGNLGRRVASQLTVIGAFSYQWSEHHRSLRGGWPGSRQRLDWEAVSTNIYPRLLAEWRNSFPETDPGDALPNDIRFDAEGKSHQALVGKSPPEPPGWFMALTPDQSAAWLALNESATRSDLSAISNQVAALIATGPPEDALANARFVQWRAESERLSSTAAIAKLSRFNWDDRRVLSESGLPLGALTFAEMLRRAGDSGPTEELWRELEYQIQTFPGYLTPLLLDQVELLVATNQVLLDGVAAWRTLWNGGERARGIAEAIQRSGKLDGITTTNLWVEHSGASWFCTLQPGEVQIHTRSNGIAVSFTNAVTRTSFYHRSLIEMSFAAALRDPVPFKQSYFGFSLELEGRPLALPALHEKSAESSSRENALAVGEFHLWLPGRMLLNHPPPGQEPEVGPEFETMPSHPRFTLRVHLADRARLFAAYHQRLLLFGGLIFASALAAFVGVVMARRAFLREQRLNELKTNFVSSVSHELRAPIASVRLMAENLERGKVTGADKLQEYVRFIGQECRRLSALIENVLDFGRIEQGRKQYEFEPTDLGKLVEETVRLMQPYAGERGVKLNAELEGRHSCRPIPPEEQGDTIPAENLGDRNVAVPELDLDGRAIQQALINLLDNAIKHSPPGSEVGVRLQRGTGNLPVLLSVADHGPGIPAAEREKIFERFYRRGSELRRETQGIGIGLSIVKHIVEAHGGRVWVESGPGQGSRFVIELKTDR